MSESVIERELEKMVEPIAERVVARLLDERREPETYLSVKTAAECLDLPEDTIRKWIQRGAIKKYKVGGCVRVKLSELVTEHDA
jgi:excisionase family DNA binding protein